MSRSIVEVDLDAIRSNVGVLMDAAPGSRLCAVVKADGYGHGAVAVAGAALEAGASVLAVAHVDEGVALRQAGIDAPIWVLSEPAHDEFATAARFHLEPAIYSELGIEAAARAAIDGPVIAHLKIDTGMHRVGAAPADALGRAVAIEQASGLVLGSVWTHCAVADEPGNPFTDLQLDRFDAVLDELEAAGVDVPLVHAANSAGTLVVERARRDIVRTGIALYGLTPSPALAETACHRGLVPALAWRSRVSFVKHLAAGDRVSYGQRTEVERPTVAATVPVGYADGYRRGLWRSGEVLIGGRRRRILGVVTMDQMVVECGADDGSVDVATGDEVVLIGSPSSEGRADQNDPSGQADRITADELAEHLDTINYEIVCGIGKRVERVHR